MTLDDFEAQFWRADTEAREGRTAMAARRIRDAAEDYAASRAAQILGEAARTATRRVQERKAS